MNLKKTLYSCVSHNEIIFQLMNEYAAEGYLFWKKDDRNAILLDANLSAKLGSDSQVALGQLKFPHQEFLESIIRKVEGVFLEVNTVPGILQATISEPVNNTHIRFAVCEDKKSLSDYILVAVQETTYFIRDRSINDISDILNVAVWQYNLSTGKVLVNEMWAQLIGYKKSELYPVTVETFEKLTHPDDFSLFQIVLEKYIRGESDEYAMEIRMRHKNGYWKWVLAKGKTVSRNEKGEVEWMMGSHIDITERKIHETEIETLAQVPLNTVNGVIITDYQGSIIFVNTAFEKMSGYQFEEVRQRKPGHFLQGPLTAEQDKISFSRKLSSGKSFTQEILNYTKSGEPYTIECFVDPVFDQKGELIKFISVQKDITEEKRNKEYLATFKNTLDQTQDCIFIFDKDTLQFTYVNQGAIQMMGYSKDKLLQLHPFDIKPDYSEVAFRNLIKPLQNGEKMSQKFQTVHRNKHGADIPVEVFLQFIRNESISPHFVAIVKDISEQLAFEKQLKRLSLVAEKTNNLVMITDQNGLVEYMNPAFEAKTGYSLNELKGKKPGRFLHGEATNPLHIKANRDGLKKLKPFTQEILNYTKSGEKYWVSITFNPVFNARRELTNFIAIEKDITEKKQKENLLKESEERLRFVLKGSELGYWDWEADSGKMTVNDRWYEMLGYTREDFDPSIENWHALVHPEDMTMLHEIMETVFPDPTKSEFATELRARHKDGDYVWILDRGAVVERDESGEPKRISGMHMLISQRKKLEKDLEEERNFLNKIISASVLSLVIINKSGKITFANTGAENILGLKKNKIESSKYNDPTWMQITLDGAPFPQEELPFVQVMNSKMAVKDIQHGIIWQDGTIKYISVTGAPLNFFNEEVEDLIFSVTDITDRVLAQQQLDQTKNRMQSILKDMVDVVWSVKLPEYKTLYVTPSIERLTGFPLHTYPGELLKETWENRIYRPDRHLLEKAYIDLHEKGSFEAEYRIVAKDGTIKWVLNKAKLIKENGVAIRFDIYLADISERKEQESSVKKYLSIVEDQNERLKNFTYIVSHNLRSHSANIQGLVYLINRKHPDIAENEFIKMLSKASNKLDETLHHLNNVVSIVSTTEEMKQVKLSDAVTFFSDTFENLILESRICFLNEISGNVVVEAVPAFLESIITNLLTNAIKYRDPLKPDSYVRISSRSFNGIVILEIEDNGLGIDLEKYGDKLFGMYKTFHANTDSRGLGLFLTKNQIESMGGKITVESLLGKGSTFKIYLKDGSI